MQYTDRTSDRRYTFLGIYHTYKVECEYYYKRGWNDDTEIKYDRIIERIVSLLPDHNNRPISSYTKEDYEHIVDVLRSKGQNFTLIKKRSAIPFVPYSDKTIDQYMSLVKAVVAVGAQHSYCLNVFEVSAPTDDIKKKGAKRTRAKANFLPKSLSIPEEIAVMNYILKHLEDIGEAVGLLLMFACGLRNEEACSLNFADIVPFETCPSRYYIRVTQSTEIKKNTLKLNSKSDNGIRKIPISNNLAELLFFLWDRRRSKTSSLSTDFGDALSLLPIVCRKQEYTKRARADQLSTEGRKMFCAIGMREDYLMDIADYLLQHADIAVINSTEDEFRLVEKDPTSYLLRRNFATHLSILGLTESEIQYIIGHELGDRTLRRDIANSEHRLLAIADKLEQRPLLNIINPIVTIDVSKKESGCFSSAYHYQFVVPANTTLRINAQANEPGSKLAILTHPEHIDDTTQHTTFYIDTPTSPSQIINILRTYHLAYKQIYGSGNSMLLQWLSNQE